MFMTILFNHFKILLHFKIEKSVNPVKLMLNLKNRCPTLLTSAHTLHSDYHYRVTVGTHDVNSSYSASQTTVLIRVNEF